MFKIILSILFITSTVLAGNPPVSVKGQNGTKLLPKWNLQFPGKTVDNLGGIDAYVATGNKNILIDGDVQASGTTGWAGGGSVTLSKDTTTPLFGAKNLRGVYSGAASTDNQIYQQAAIPSGLVGINLEFSVYIRTSSASITFCPINDAGAACSQNIAVTGDGAWHLYTWNEAGKTGATLGLAVNRASASGTPVTVDIALPYVGIARNISTGIPPNTFTAKVSAAGVVSDETGGDWINGNLAVTDTSLFTATFTSSFFTATPTCTMSATGNNQVTTTEMSSASATAVAFRTSNSTTGSKVAVSFNITCTKTGADYVQNAITPQNYDYGRTAYTPTFTGFGTPTSVECFHAREGEFLNIDCKFAAGTSTGVEGRISLPSGLTSADSTKIPSIRAIPGRFYRNNSGGSTRKAWVTLIEPSVSYVVFGSDDYVLTSAPLTKLNGNDMLGTGETGSFTARVPIQGWSVTQNAPQLLGSVTSNAPNALRTEYAVISAGGVVSGASSSWLSSCTNAAPYVCSFVGTPFSAASYVCTVQSNTGNFRFNAVNAKTTSGFSISQGSSAGSLVNNDDMQIICIGPR